MSRRFVGILAILAVAAFAFAPAVVCVMSSSCPMDHKAVQRDCCTPVNPSDGWNRELCHQQNETVYLKFEKILNPVVELTNVLPVAIPTVEAKFNPISLPVLPVSAVPRFLLACSLRL